MQHRKLFVSKVTGIALLIAGLFLFGAGLFLFKAPKEPASNPQELTKPSQMTFSNGNKFSEDFNAKPEASGPTAVEATAAPELPENEIPAWQALDQILKSKNDNDPRLDKDLKNLSPQFHKALYGKYESLRPEDRNERGTLVFLVARDLKNEADVSFLQKVYEEAPCLNMANCSAPGVDDPQDTGSQQTSLNYPQLAGLYQIDSQLTQRPQLLQNPQFRAGIYALLKTAENFPAPQVHEKAKQIREKYGL